ncbi:unnamed protein product [Bursaphelenchus xylophilus]|uniref:(pine wood nematode) hypothetical protein n=1 Tax=Bursaphelenchus xylophilus TaxID=6326 RepID=A0A1I7S5A0_BURXY|nr:unnamed protein product [Bursaphelenchus xylophilus]CAG9117852.1 unnamed protein product [Bursaphelenchus xylophilus]
MTSTHIVGVDADGLVYYAYGGEKVKLKCLVSQQDMEAEFGSDSCWVCSSPANGIHFKAVSCAACNAFFRRSIASKRVYLCRKDGDCAINKNVRCLCRACRLKKCVFVGMDARVVQPQRGALHEPDSSPKQVVPKGIKIENKCSPNSDDLSIRSDTESVLSHRLFSDKSSVYEADLNKPSVSSELCSSPSCSSQVSFKIIDAGLTAYKKLLDRRRIIYTTTSLADMMSGVEPEFRKHGSADHHRLECAQIRTWVANAMEFFGSFYFLNELDVKDRCAMFKAFLVNFINLEKYYLTYKKGGAVQNRIYCQDYIYIDLNELIEATNGEKKAFKQGDKVMDSATTNKINLPDCIKAMELLVRPMHELQMDDTEFICCAVSMMFDSTLIGVNPAIKSLGSKIRNQLYQEWFQYYDSMGFKHEEAAMRMGNALLIAPTLIEFVNHIKQNFHLMRVFGAGDEYDKVLNDIFLD